MREIKFRGQRLDNGEWVVGTVEFHLVDGDLTQTKQDVFITYDSMDKIGKVYRDRCEVDPSTIGQFTGLKDKNGVEIFEGDVGRVKRIKYEIVFKDACLYAIQINFTKPNTNTTTYRLIDTLCKNGLEVIGNIHTPELKKGE
jgi:uncharacterized phage protein (TIGR01671 family)